MKVLLVTGQLAKEKIHANATKANVDFQVEDLPISVAAFLSPKMIVQRLRKKELSSFDLILVPGLMKGNTFPIEKKLETPTYKGTEHASDLPLLLKRIQTGEIELSHSKPADDVIQLNREKEIENVWTQVEHIERDILRQEKGFMIGSLPLSKQLPIRIAAEIIDAPTLSQEELVNRAKYYVRSGADIIDIGMIAGEDHSNQIEEIVDTVSKAVEVPLSIDSLNANEIRGAADSGVDMIVSLDGTNMNAVAERVKDTACVIIPHQKPTGQPSETVEERLHSIERNIEKARKLGIEKILVDLILNPPLSPSLMESLDAFYQFAQEYPRIPLFMGVGNATELMDADSIGINATLTGIASEIGVDILLTTEASDKTVSSVKEVSKACKMMYLSKQWETVPKDLGLDLLHLKEKQKRDEQYPYPEDITITQAKESQEPTRLDEKGFFRIWIDEDESEILALHFPLGDDTEPDVLIKGANAEVMYKTILEKNLISQMSHAAYLAKELTKAEIALKTGRSYIQEENVFPSSFF